MGRTGHGIRSIMWVGAAAIMAGACAVGAPPGFSSGDTWGFPLVGPLEDGLLVVPVKVNGKGPFLFMIDPDSEMSSVDGPLASSLELYTVQGLQLADETDTMRNIAIAETDKLEIADLTISNMKVRVHPANRLWAGGRMLRGILGRDVVSEGMILAVDRDRGMVYLASQQGSVAPPPGAVEVKGRRFHGRLLVPATVNRSKNVTVHVDVGAPTAMLLPSVIAAAHLPTRAVQARLVDELGTERNVTSGALAAKVAVGAAEGDAVLVLPFADKRFRDVDFDGVLGQTFLAGFHLTINFHKNLVALKPRTADPAELARERMRRWGARFDACERPACVIASLEPPAAAPPAPVPASEPAGEAGEGAAPAAAIAPVPPSPPVARKIELRREPVAAALDYEVVLEAVDADGAPLGLPRLRATLPANVETVVEPNGAPYAAAAGFRVLDLSPFPRPCEPVGEGYRCVWAMADLK